MYTRVTVSTMNTNRGSLLLTYFTNTQLEGYNTFTFNIPTLAYNKALN